tara:strand:- start:1661 stop:2050 length:390 start_codon:yes stop_codon:yes gene_type:complete
MKREMSLKISLNEIIDNGLEYERKVMENLFRFSNFVGTKQFKVIFLHKKLDSKKIDEFVKRNENILFHISSKITSNNCTAWFVIEQKKVEHKYLTYRYKYLGTILEGLPKYFNIVKTLKDKYESSNNRK